MTTKQFYEKAKIARACGEAKLDGGATLNWNGCYWTIKAKDGQTVDTADTLKSLEYLA